LSDDESIVGQRAWDCDATTSAPVPRPPHTLRRVMFRVLKEIFGQFDWVQRSLIFTYVGLEQRPISYIYRSFDPRPSRDQTDLFIAKCERRWGGGSVMASIAPKIGGGELEQAWTA